MSDLLHPNAPSFELLKRGHGPRQARRIKPNNMKTEPLFSVKRLRPMALACHHKLNTRRIIAPTKEQIASSPNLPPAKTPSNSEKAVSQEETILRRYPGNRLSVAERSRYKRRQRAITWWLILKTIH